MPFESALSWANFILLCSLLAILCWRRVFRILPIFVAYQVYSVLFAIPSLLHTSNTSGYVLFWSLGIVADTLFFLWVCVELGRNVHYFNDASAWPAVLFLLLFAGAALPIALLVRWSVPPAWSLVWHFEFRVMQSSAIVETAALLTLAWWSGLKSLRWPECELRLVMGFGFWTLVQMAVLILHEHGFRGAQYRWIDYGMPLSVLGIFIYWLHYFWLAPHRPQETRFAGRDSHSGSKSKESAQVSVRCAGQA